MDGGAWWAVVHGVARSWTPLSDFTFTFHFHALEEEMATHSSVLPWRIPGMGEPGGLLFLGSHRVGHMNSMKRQNDRILKEEELATHSSVLAWRIPGTGEPCGLPSMGSHRVGHDWRDLAAAAVNSQCFPSGPVVKKKNPPDNAGDMGSIPGLGRSPGEGNGNPL